MEERRASPRSSISCKISVTSDFRILVFNAGVENIGEGGIRIVLRERLDIAAPLDVELFLPDKGKSIICSGEVIWVNEKIAGGEECSFDAGIKFINISEEDRARIRSL
jgi:hypothetical protein